MSTVIKKTSDSSTAPPVVQEHPNCSGCSQFSNPQSGSVHTQPSELLTLWSCLGQLSSIQSEINALKADVETEKARTTGFYESITTLSKTSQKAIWILLIIPMLQLLACAVVVYYLGIQENLPSLLTWVLSGVSLLSVIEMIMLPIKFATMENRMNEIERKLSKHNDSP